MNNVLKEVDFYGYCATCKYEKEAETSEKCSECLENPVNFESERPVCWEEKL